MAFRREARTRQFGRRAIAVPATGSSDLEFLFLSWLGGLAFVLVMIA